MSHPLVECVPNFSEGRDPAVIAAITAAIAAVEGVSLLDVDPGRATNRTVVTLVGAPEAVLEGAFQGIKAAQQRIDMRKHKGAHPRIGATDVCPFVPVRDLTMEQCAELARRLGERVGRELGVPVYLYEHAASRPERRNLAVVREGEHEGLEAKLADPAWTPDHGPSQYSEAVARSGATVIGARPFLIAFNVNLNTKNTRLAMKIAAQIREQGIYRREGADFVLDAAGEKIRDPGLFKCVKAIGWYIEEYGRCQVSINFTDHHQSPLHEVVEATRRVALEEGVVVTGSELVGLVPLDALLAAGRFYLRRQGSNPGASEAELIAVAVRSMGLSELAPFEPEQAIVERRIGGDGPLVGKTVRDFTDTLASDAPAPGGGSVAALCGAMSAGLSAMVAQLSTDKRSWVPLEERWCTLGVRAQELKEAMLTDVDADTAAFDAVMASFGLPRGTPEERRARGRAIQAATRGAIEVPLRVLERSAELVELAELAAQGNANARSDAGVAGLTAAACAQGAWYNVLINVKSLRDKEQGALYRERADAALERVQAGAERVRQLVLAEIAG